jgi:outer membrane protein insertion porin family
MIFNRKTSFLLLLLCVSVSIFQSCVPKNKFLFVFNRTSVKNPPKDTFVFANEIHITPGIIAKDEENRLESDLAGYWDDSVKAREVQQFGLFYRIKNAQHFDTFALDRSKVFMRSYLQSQGYYNATLNDTFRIDTFKFATHKQQFRAVPIMLINTGKRLKIDSIAYNFIDTSRPSSSDTVLQQLAMQKKSESALKKGDPYSKQIIATELDRLVSWYRQNGFYRLTRENLVAYVDTTDHLIDSLTIDPFELARRIAEASERRKVNPQADIEIMQATKVKEIPFDSMAVKRYYIGNIYYYPETSDTALADTLLKRNQFNVRGKNNVFMKYPGNDARFHYKVFTNHTYTTKGELYNERLFYKTVNSFGQMGPWRQVELRDSIRQDTVDFHVFLTAYKRMNIKFAVDLTRSTADFISSNNLFGVGGNVTFIHRNFFKDAVQFSATGRAGVELNLEPGQQLLQTVQGGFGVNFGFQNAFLTRRSKQKQFDAARSLLSFNSSYTERKEFYRLRSLTASFGDEWAKGGWVKTLRPINVELYSLDVLPELEKAFLSNPFLKTAFNTGSVFSSVFTYTSSTWPWRSTPKRNHYFRFGGEYAGWPIDLFSPFPSTSTSLKKNLYHYAKGELEIIEKFQKTGSANVLVLRGFAGVGVPISGQTLPFFKQFVAGGPNSMRAWGLRQLGLGHSKLSDTATTFRDRFGDLQLEANIEYRFPLANVGSAKFSSAVFMDIGNLWNIRNDPSNPQGTFRLSPFPDFAIAAGVGLLRLNVANFIFRVDFALKVKDPAVRENDGWLFKKFTWKNENDRNNYAFQIGIGLPF